MTLEISLALLALAAPLTAGIFKLVPQRTCLAPLQDDDKYLTTREFDNFRAELRESLTCLKTQVEDIKKIVDPLR